MATNNNDDITKRMNYFDRQFLRADDFKVEQAYHIDRRRRHNQYLHKKGVASGLQVSIIYDQNRKPEGVMVRVGWAIDNEGREIIVPENHQQKIGITDGVNIYIKYKEELDDSSSDPGANGFKRVQEKFEICSTISTIPDQGILLAQVRQSGNSFYPEDKRTPASIADDSITSAAIAEADDTSGQNTNTGKGIKTGHIQNDAVTKEKLQSSASDNNKRAVGTDHIRNNAVTDEQLSSDATSDSNRAVGTNHIKDAAVTNTKIADNAVTTVKIKEGSVTADKLDNNLKKILLAAFLSFDGTAASSNQIKNSFNVDTAKTKRTARGKYTITWQNPINANGPFICWSWNGNKVLGTSKTTTELKLEVKDANGTLIDDHIMVMVAS